MASLGRKNQSLSRSNQASDSILFRVPDYLIVRKGKTVAYDMAYVTKRLMKSTGKTSWIVANSFIVRGLSLIIKMDRDVQLNELELQQVSSLGTPASLPSFMGPSS